MGAPFPPSGEQKQYTERPLKIYGEQYIEGDPLPMGVVIDPPDFPPTGDARILTTAGWRLIVPTDWVVSSRYSGQPVDVISDEEFTERFGGGGGPPLPEV